MYFTLHAFIVNLLLNLKSWLVTASVHLAPILSPISHNALFLAQFPIKCSYHFANAIFIMSIYIDGQYPSTICVLMQHSWPYIDWLNCFRPFCLPCVHCTMYMDFQKNIPKQFAGQSVGNLELVSVETMRNN